MTPTLSFAISCVALVISGVTAWLTFFRKGELVMTQPTVIFFGPDGSRFDGVKNKIFLRTLLYSTAKRGQVVESLHVSVHHNETQQNFNIWVYGEKGNLSRGSGLFVPQEGIASDHHFLLPEDGANFTFRSGTYKFTVYAKRVGKELSHILFSTNLDISEAQASQLIEPNVGIYFDWGPDQHNYHSHIDKKPQSEPEIEKIIEIMANKALQSGATEPRR